MAALDQVRDKWESITPRERRMVVVLGVSFVFIMIIYVALEIRDGLASLEAKNQKARRALAALTAYKAQAQSATPADDPVKLIGATEVKLETYIYAAGEKAKVTVPEVKTRSPNPKGAYTAHAAGLELREISLTQAKDFLEAIESDSKVVKVSALQLRRNFRDKEKLDLSVEVVTWSKPDAEKKDGEGGGSGSGSGTAKAGG
jgi:hypothetical protein